MFKLIVIALFATVALCYEDDLEVYHTPEDVLIPVEALPPNTLIRLRRQVFGGRSNLPGGGFNQQIGYRGTPAKDVSAWGSMSQSFDRRGFSSPISYSGGVDYTRPSGTGLSASALHVPKQGSQGTLGGTFNLVNTPKHNLNAFGSHTKTFDPNFREIGRGSSTAGLNYQNANGAQASLSGTRTPGLPNSATVAGSVPLYNSNNGRTQLSAGGQSTFTQGQKPNHQVGLSLNHQFR